jgi:tetratricopeptide (TPR) repeat protein
MRVGGLGIGRLGLSLLAALLAWPAPSARATPVDDAAALYRQKKFPEARAILEPITSTQPANAPASYWLGMVFLRQGGPTGLDSARLWLGRALKLDPDNESYQADYAGVCLLMADRDNSFSLALEGRDGMTRAIAANPSDLAACEGLMRFYAKAPWPLGNAARARSLADHIAKLDSKRGAAAYLAIAAIFEKDGRKQESLSAAQAAQALAQDHPH